VSLLRLEGVSKSYGPVTALAAVDLAVAAGSRTAVVGPSGSGKTTLLRVIAGFEVPDSGRITLDGALLADGPAARPAHLRGIGVVSQDGGLFPHLSVADNIGFGLARRDPGREARVRELMDMVELDPGLGRRRPDQLSGGQQQRVALARALARRPRLMLLDEPFSALDTGLRAGTRRAVASLLEAAGIASVLVTHDQEEALAFADQLAVFRNGRLAQAGPPRELYLHPRDAQVAAFLGDAIILSAELAGGTADCALGRVAVDGDRRGPAEIVLRPEQLLLEPVDGAEPGNARVVHVEFGGAACRITVVLDAAKGAPAHRVALRGSPLAVPAVGSRARLVATGTAHVLDAAPDRVPSAPAATT
jgi:iron(III) transport system ATP-binding protein